MKIEITPEDSRLLCELLSAHRARTIQSLETFCNTDRSGLSEHSNVVLDRHISFISSNLKQIDNLFSELREVMA